LAASKNASIVIATNRMELTTHLYPIDKVKRSRCRWLANVRQSKSERASLCQRGAFHLEFLSLARYLAVNASFGGG